MFTIEQDRAAGYRPTVGIILLYQGMVLLGRESGGWSWCKGTNADGKLLTDFNAPDHEFGWKIPQGGIEPGETVRGAFFREIGEELETDFILCDVGQERHWLKEISEPVLFRHERQDFPFTRDGINYIGKSYHYCVAAVGYIEENYNHWTYGHRDDEGPYPSFPTREFPGGVFFADYIAAQVLITQRHLGRASTRALSVIHQLYAKKLIERTGCGFRMNNDGTLSGLPVITPNYDDIPGVKVTVIGEFNGEPIKAYEFPPFDFEQFCREVLS